MLTRVNVGPGEEEFGLSVFGAVAAHYVRDGWALGGRGAVVSDVGHVFNVECRVHDAQ
jgi:hypothetical protein